MKSTDQEFLDTIEHCKAIILKAATFYTGSKEEKEDLVQDIIYQIWKSFDSFKGQSKRSTWIYRIAMNTALYHWRSQRNRQQLLDQWVLNSPDENTDLRWEQLMQQVNQLNHLDKSLIFLYLERKSYAEISEITGLSESNVGTRMNRIKQKLRKAIKQKVWN